MDKCGYCDQVIMPDTEHVPTKRKGICDVEVKNVTYTPLDYTCRVCLEGIRQNEIHYTTAPNTCLVIVKREDDTYYVRDENWCMYCKEYIRPTEDHTYIEDRKYCRVTNKVPSQSIGQFANKKAAVSQTPEGQGKRDKIRPRHDLIPLEFLDELASIFEEGRRPRPNMPEGYGDSWKLGGKEFVRDCLNHASNHLFRYMNGDMSENQLAKVAWNVLVVRYHDLQIEKAEKEKDWLENVKKGLGKNDQ